MNGFSANRIPAKIDPKTADTCITSSYHAKLNQTDLRRNG